MGWAAGMISGIWMFIAANYASVYVFNIGGQQFGIYSAVSSLVLNLLLVVILTPIFRAAGMTSGKDNTRPADYEEEIPEKVEPLPEALG